MGQWKEERDLLLADPKLGRDIRHVLTKTAMADDAFFDIPRMRPYFTVEKLSYAVRMKVAFVTSFSNCQSPIHAARIYTSLYYHFKDKLRAASFYVAVQDPINSAEWGSVSDTHVTFDVVFSFKSDTQVSAPVNYLPRPQMAAQEWRKLYGDRDPYKVQSGSATTAARTTPQTTPTSTPAVALQNAISAVTTNTNSAVSSNTTPAAGSIVNRHSIILTDAAASVTEPVSDKINQLQPEVPPTSEGMSNRDYLKSLREGMRSSLAPGKKEDPPKADPDDGLPPDAPRALSNWRGTLYPQEENRIKDLADGANYVAVYGSLREGEHNNHLLRNAIFHGTGRIRGVIFPLGSTVPGAYFPKAGGVGMATSADADRGVVVEVYQVSRAVMDALDRLENYTGNSATSSYERVVRMAKMDDGGERRVFVYEYTGRASRSDEFIGNGDWISYRNAHPTTYNFQRHQRR